MEASRASVRADDASDVLRCTVTLNNELVALQVHLDGAAEWDTLQCCLNEGRGTQTCNILSLQRREQFVKQCCQMYEKCSTQKAFLRPTKITMDLFILRSSAASVSLFLVFVVGPPNRKKALCL